MKEMQPWDGPHHATLHLPVPVHFRMLCSLLGAEIENVLLRFMETVGSEYYQPDDFAHPEGTSFFVLSNFGAPHFRLPEVRQMIDELGMVRAVYPGEADETMLQEFTRWRAGYRKQWYESWLRKKEEKTAAS